MDDHDPYGGAELIQAQDVSNPPEFDEVLKYQGRKARQPSGQGNKRFFVLGASTRANGQGGFKCLVLLHGHEPVPCQEFLENWRLPKLN